MGRRRGTRGANRAPWLILSLVAAGLAVPSLGAQTAPQNLTIAITGDEDLCNDEDHDGVVGTDDGIVNCDTADGSANRPYIIRDLTLQRSPTGPADFARACAAGRGGPDCYANCSNDLMAALIAICHTTLHLRLENLRLTAAHVPDPSRNDAAPAALFILASRNLTVAEARISAVGQAILVRSDDLATSQLTLVGVTASGPQGGDRTPVSLAAGASLPLVQLENADVVIERLDVQGQDREHGLQLGGTGPEPYRARLDSVRVRDILTTAIRLTNVDAAVRNLQLLNIGTAGGRDVEGLDPTTPDDASLEPRSMAILVEASSLDLNTGVIVFHGGAIDVDGRSILSSQIVTYMSETPRAPVVILRPSAMVGCQSRLHFNEFLNTTVLRNDDTCAVSARENWWGVPSAEGDRIDGLFELSPILAAPIAKLPRVAITAPRSMDAAYDVVILEGTATSHDGTPVTSVEASTTEGEWYSRYVATGGAAWEMQVPVEGDPGDVFRIWVRACSRSGCGVPSRIELTVTREPRAPIAILEATPRIVKPEEPVSLDASASYSPIGLPIVEYTFTLGDNTVLGPLTRPTAEHRFRSPGLYQVSLTVRDQGGVQSSGVASLTINVRDPEAPKNLQRDPVGAMPGPGWETLVAAAAAALLLGRWRPRD